MKKPKLTIVAITAFALIGSSCLAVFSVVPREGDTTSTTKYLATTALNGETSVNEVRKAVELLEGGTGPNPGNGTNPVNPQNPAPTPTGSYIKVLGDGTSVYWYHQSADGCVYDTTVANMTWGKEPQSASSFTSNGCAIYTLAMIFSNLCNQDITPLQVLTTLGCTVTYDQNGIPTFCATNQTYFSGIMIKREDAVKKLCSTYNCSYTKANTETEYDAVLAKNGYVYDQWKHASNLPWLSNTGNGVHFMAVRKKDTSGKYYCLTSTDSDATKYMDQGAPINTVLNSRTNTDRGIGIYHN